MRCSAKLYRATLTALLMMAASAGIVVADPSKDAKLIEELSALRAKLISLWNPSAAVSTHPDQYVITIRIRLATDHRLVGQPEVLTNSGGPLFEAVRDSAVRAVLQAQPYDMLSYILSDKPMSEEQWIAERTIADQRRKTIDATPMQHIPDISTDTET
jgi:hypothetical protein